MSAVGGGAGFADPWPARVRFAPSPTGPLHVGSARTALLNWLFVRSPVAGDGDGAGAGDGGPALILRIDDTDRERSHVDLESAILDDLRWLGLDWNEGPLRQSDRAARYAEALAALPTVERDGAREFDGRVIARADGSALYHLATAVDDLDFGITHVLRGRDHESNVPLQSAIIAALGGRPPRYVHAPLLTLPDGAKISKREGHETGGPDLTIAGLREAGYPASALLNHLALSLADFGVDEVMTDPRAIAERFSLENLHTADSHFDFDKLRWISGRHIRALSDDALAAALRERLGFDPPAAALAAARTGGETFAECASAARGLVDPPEPNAEAAALAATPEAALAAEALLDLLGGEGAAGAGSGATGEAPAGAVARPPAGVDEAERVFAELKSALRERDVKLGPALRGLRARLTGRAHGPEFPYVLATLSAERLAQLRDHA